jgi:CubicO group peptidase (beta-lactamase class C family)
MKLLTISLLLFCGTTTFAQTIPAGSHGASLNVSKLADEIEQRYKSKCVGFQFVISYKDQFEVQRAWGKARRAQDQPNKDMTNGEQYNIASVSKPITGAALMFALAHRSDLTVDSKIWPCLPSHWHVDNTVKVITFRDLLTHTSGFRSGAESYADLKTMIAQGIHPADHGVDKYENCNYAIMRLLIPKVAKLPVVNIPDNASPAIVAAQEPIQTLQYAIDYMDFVQKKLFTPTGLPSMRCKPAANDPALCYQFPETQAHGGDFGDWTLTCGAAGWNMSTRQMSTFFSHLHHTNQVWSDHLNNYMKQLCYEIGTTTKGVSYYEKEGYFPGGSNPGELNSVIVGFGNGIIVVLIANSQAPSVEDTVRAAFDAWYH